MKELSSSTPDHDIPVSESLERESSSAGLRRSVASWSDLRSWKVRLCSIALALLSGALLACCFPGWNQTNLVWFWVWPLCVALWWPAHSLDRPGDLAESPKSWKLALRGMFLGWLAGATFCLMSFFWLMHVHPVAPFALGAYLALYFGFWGAFASTVGRLNLSKLFPWRVVLGERLRAPFWQSSLECLRVAILNAAAWTFLEWARGYVMTGFGWNGLGVALHEQIMLIQIAEWVGVTGLSFPIMFVSLVGFISVVRLAIETLKRCMRPHLDFMIAALVIMGIFLFGVRRLMKPQGETESYRVLLVQMNHSLEERRSDHIDDIENLYRDYYFFTVNSLVDPPPDLVVWPEGALPDVFTDPYVVGFMNDLLSQGDFSLMTGMDLMDIVVDPEESDRFYNAAVILKGNHSEHQIYRKMHLVPFGEFLPLRDTIPWMDTWFGDLLPGDFSRGEETRTLDFKPTGKTSASIIPIICFEDTIGRLIRRFVMDPKNPKEGPQFMVNVTNDAWFPGSAAIEQHLLNAMFRTVELRRPMLRAANTGISAIIDESGSFYQRDASPGNKKEKRILKDPETGETEVAGTLPGELTVAKHPPLTFYALFGDVFSYGCGMLSCFATLLWGLSQWKGADRAAVKLKAIEEKALMRRKKLQGKMR